jgi:hypothetical protein
MEIAAQKATGSANRADGIDPDLAGIKAGPQPLQDWQIEQAEQAEQVETETE